MLRVPRSAVALLLVAAFVGLGLAASPSLCHEVDEACRTDAQHHADSSCQCSCHAPATIPSPPTTRSAGDYLNLDISAVESLPTLVPGQPEPPPRG